MCTCASHPAEHPAEHPSAEAAPAPRAAGRRTVLRAAVLGGGAAALAGLTAQSADAAQAAPGGRQPGHRGTELVLLGTAGGPPPLAARTGIASALVVNGRTYVIDAGRGAVTQFMRAGLSMPSLAGIFVTHLHADHTVDLFSFPLLSAGVVGRQGFQKPIDVYGPGSAGRLPDGPPPGSHWVGADDPVPGVAALLRLSNAAFAYSTNGFIAEHMGSDPADYVRVHEIQPPASAGASASNTAPRMDPFPVMENDDLKVTAILVPHGPVFPALAYRIETEDGVIVFSGDTARTPNVPRLAAGADVLVHEAFHRDAVAAIGYPPAVVEHIGAVHTEVGELGAVGVEADARHVVISHITPADPAALSDAAWQKAADRSARKARYRGRITLGTDLARFPVAKPRR
ncbi:MBL fold metallo-hydrolase [Actinomadura montaniterrae]|uniref:MBL fold metallo-hydrolase n=1 Tax=Actinomadura montaniterrae TaxID=1803903 RepID=A0A6L3VJV0_9ACTN|nr:MBL fold metallo-hydrolase [Actinomadura montaniterrae]KAB2371316.1 MBL fold metallo-hydrolase [Actinomadura montaniterrae]